MHLYQGLKKSFPFKIQTPIGLPSSYKSIDRNVVWSLKGVVAVKDRPDATSKIELLFSPAPLIPTPTTPAMTPCEYYGTLFPETEMQCPNCGAFRKAL